MEGGGTEKGGEESASLQAKKELRLKKRMETFRKNKISKIHEMEQETGKKK